jgi:hypothetical protein
MSGKPSALHRPDDSVHGVAYLEPLGPVDVQVLGGRHRPAGRLAEQKVMAWPVEAQEGAGCHRGGPPTDEDPRSPGGGGVPRSGRLDALVAAESLSAHVERLRGNVCATRVDRPAFLGNRAQARRAVFEFIEIFYNRTRLHSYSTISLRPSTSKNHHKAAQAA